MEFDWIEVVGRHHHLGGGAGDPGHAVVEQDIRPPGRPQQGGNKMADVSSRVSILEDKVESMPTQDEVNALRLDG